MPVSVFSILSDNSLIDIINSIEKNIMRSENLPTSQLIWRPGFSGLVMIDSLVVVFYAVS